MTSNHNSTSQGKSRGKFIIVVVTIIALAVLGLLLSRMDERVAIVAPGEETLTSANVIVSATPLTTDNTSTPILMQISTPTSTSAPILNSTQTPYKGVQNPNNGHWYLVFSKTNWDNAINYCATRGGHLVAIEDDQENTFVYGLAPYAILGATDKDREGRWVWVTEQEMSYTNWCQGEPNNCGNLEVNGHCEPENHLTFHDIPQCISGQWNDIAVGEGEATYVCEFEE